VRDRLLIAVFMTMLVVPLLCFIVNVGTAPTEFDADRLHQKPAFTEAKSAAQFAAAWLDYFSDHFGLRRDLIEAHSYVSVRLLHTSPSSTVIIGRDHWLYYADDSALDDYESAEPLTPEDLETWRQSLMDTRDWLRAQGAQFVFMVVPDKHVIYPEYMPPSIHRLHPDYRGDQLVEYLRQHSDLSVVDGRQVLMKRKPTERVYSTTDTHWNDRGIYVGYDALLREAGRSVPGLAPLPRTAFAPVERDEPGGDLAAMIALNGVLREHELALEPLVPRRARLLEPTDLREGYEVARVVTEVPDRHLPRAVIFRDSFMSGMLPFLSEHFSRAVYMWQNDVDRDLVLRERPDLVILEIVGRRLQTYVP
jgi:hypothetical protein